MGYNTKELRAWPLEEKHKSKPKDIIYDLQGQWKYPGQVTKIPGGDITMRGVPYPVLGIDSYGTQQLMMPGMDYTFPGDSVTEYPQMGRGGGVKGTGTLDKPAHHTIAEDKARSFLESGNIRGRGLTYAQEELFKSIAGVKDVDDEGNLIDADEDTDIDTEYRRGGSLRLKRGKARHEDAGMNIFTALNFLGQRNAQLFGHRPHHPFVPSMQNGGKSLTFNDPNDPEYIRRNQAYNDSLNLYNRVKHSEENYRDIFNNVAKDSKSFNINASVSEVSANDNTMWDYYKESLGINNKNLKPTSSKRLSVRDSNKNLVYMEDAGKAKVTYNTKYSGSPMQEMIYGFPEPKEKIILNDTSGYPTKGPTLIPFKNIIPNIQPIKSRSGIVPINIQQNDPQYINRPQQFIQGKNYSGNQFWGTNNGTPITEQQYNLQRNKSFQELLNKKRQEVQSEDFNVAQFQKGGWLDKYQSGQEVQGTPDFDWRSLSADSYQPPVQQMPPTMDPNQGTSKLSDQPVIEPKSQVVAPTLDTMSFDKAFGTARQAGLKTFKWRNGIYGTQLASEVPSQSQSTPEINSIKATPETHPYIFRSPEINKEVKKGKFQTKEEVIVPVRDNSQTTPVVSVKADKTTNPYIFRDAQNYISDSNTMPGYSIPAPPYDPFNQPIIPTREVIKSNTATPETDPYIFPGGKPFSKSELPQFKIPGVVLPEYTPKKEVQEKNIQKFIPKKTMPKDQTDMPNFLPSTWYSNPSQTSVTSDGKTKMAPPAREVPFDEMLIKVMQMQLGEKAGELTSSLVHEGLGNTLSQLKNYVMPRKDQVVNFSDPMEGINRNITPLDILKNSNDIGANPDSLYKKQVENTIKKEQEDYAQRNDENLIPNKTMPLNDQEYIKTFAVPTGDKKVSFRNRGEMKDVKGDQLFYTFAPFKSYEEHRNKNYAGIELTDQNMDNYDVLAVDNGKLVGGKMKDFKDRKDVKISPTYKISNVKELEISNKNYYNPGIEQKVLQFKTNQGNSVNSTIGLGANGQGDEVSNWSGGHLVIENPETKEIVTLHGTGKQLKAAVNKYKKNHNLDSINVYETDHKSYAVIRNRKNKHYDAAYNINMDNVNSNWSGSGNFVYLPEKPKMKLGGQTAWLDNYL